MEDVGQRKSLYKLSGVSSLHRNKENKSYKHMSGNEWLLSLIETLHSTIKYLYIFYLSGHLKAVVYSATIEN
jgi:hypothetical protein